MQDYTNAVADPFNSVMYVRNVVSGAWDKLEYFVSCLGEYEGTLIAGDSIGKNVFNLFSGFDDDDSPSQNHWQDGQFNLGTEHALIKDYVRSRGEDADAYGFPVGFTVFTVCWSVGL